MKRYFIFSLSTRLFILVISTIYLPFSANATSFNFTFINDNTYDITLEAVLQSEKANRDPNKSWSVCMGNNWYTPHPSVKIAAGNRYTVENVDVKQCKPSANTWKIAKDGDEDVYGYIQFVNNYSISINDGKFSALIRNFYGVDNTKDPVEINHPIAISAYCGKNLDEYCLDENVKMARGGNIEIRINSGRITQ